MYTLLRESTQGVGGAVRQPVRRRRLSLVSRTVLLLGFTSLFTDISSEMVSAVLPLYIVLTLGFTPLQFGVIDGLYQGAGTLVRLASGLVADRWSRHKDVAVAGYALSALAKAGLLLVGGAWTGLSFLVMVDRTGKGIRTAPRDALISLNTHPDSLGLAFGVHRALDTLGALLGPVLAFGLLTLSPSAFDSIFLVSLCMALIGLGILVLLVEPQSQSQPHHDEAQDTNHPLRETTSSAGSVRAAMDLLRRPAMRRLLLAGTLLSLTTISDGFLYLVLQRQLDFSLGLFPLLYVATALAYFLLAIPAGWLADRVGRGRVFVAGYILLLGVYALVLRADAGTLAVGGAILLFGAYYAATDGVLMAQASAVIPGDVRTSGLALLTTATSLARLLGSVLFGALWSWQGADHAVVLLGLGLLVAIIVAAVALGRSPRPIPPEDRIDGYVPA